MNRVKDYIQFAVCFAGLGYIAFWPLTAHDNTIARFEASLICDGPFSALTDAICRVPHAVTLSPGLHLLGQLAAATVVLRCLMRRWQRRRRAFSGTIIIPPELHSPIQRLPAMRRPAAPPPRPVKPRRQFGLRGVAH